MILKNSHERLLSTSTIPELTSYLRSAVSSKQRVSLAGSTRVLQSCTFAGNSLQMHSCSCGVQRGVRRISTQLSTPLLLDRYRRWSKNSIDVSRETAGAVSREKSRKWGTKGRILITYNRAATHLLDSRCWDQCSWVEIATGGFH